jgi:hypothetical protein
MTPPGMSRCGAAAYGHTSVHNTSVRLCTYLSRPPMGVSPVTSTRQTADASRRHRVCEARRMQDGRAPPGRCIGRGEMRWALLGLRVAALTCSPLPGLRARCLRKSASSGTGSALFQLQRPVSADPGRSGPIQPRSSCQSCPRRLWSQDTACAVHADPGLLCAGGWLDLASCQLLGCSVTSGDCLQTPARHVLSARVVGQRQDFYAVRCLSHSASWIRRCVEAPQDAAIALAVWPRPGLHIRALFQGRAGECRRPMRNGPVKVR